MVRQNVSWRERERERERVQLNDKVSVKLFCYLPTVHIEHRVEDSQEHIPTFSP